MSEIAYPSYDLNRLLRTAGLAGAIAALAVALAGFFFPRLVLSTYLVAYLFWLGISLGSLAIHMLHHLTGGGWGIPIRRGLESAAGTLPLMAILFLPIAFGIKLLYPWANEEVISGDEILQRKLAYLNPTSFYLRAGIYFAVWIVWALALNLFTATDNTATQQRRERMLGIFSGWGLGLWGLSVTFASVDWAMSLEPHWFSSMYGVLFMAGQAVAAMSWAVLVAIAFQEQSPKNVLNTSRRHDLGNFLLAFVMFWSYVSFMQYLIIWSANLPEETPWYILRSDGGWQVVVGALMLLHFLVPFLLLLIRQVKRVARRLVGIAALLLVMRFIDLCWLVLPPLAPVLVGENPIAEHSHIAPAATSLLQLWPLILTMIAVGGLWCANFAWLYAKRRDLTVYEPMPDEEAAHVRAEHAAH